MKQQKRAPDAAVHPLDDGMVVTLSKHGLAKIKEGQMVELDLLSGGKRVKYILMRDTTWDLKKKLLSQTIEDSKLDK